MDPETCDTRDDLRIPAGKLGDDLKKAYEKDENDILVNVIAA